MLEMHDYDVHTATNGVEALDLLKDSSKEPDIIISDIMMPEMDGYTFYNKVSENPTLSTIPFVFMSAKSSPEDIRFGKKLGVDDYITKPFEEEDLLAVIEGKIRKNQRTSELRGQFEEQLVALLKQQQETTVPADSEIVLFIFDWDENIGPILKDHYPPMDEISTPIEDIGLQLYNTSISIYGHVDYSNPEGTLLRMQNFNKDAYVFFDAEYDEEVRGNQRLYMVVAVAHRIHYLASLRIQELSKEIAEKYKNHQKLDMKDYHMQVREILR